MIACLRSYTVGLWLYLFEDLVGQMVSTKLYPRLLSNFQSSACYCAMAFILGDISSFLAASKIKLKFETVL